MNEHASRFSSVLSSELLDPSQPFIPLEAVIELNGEKREIHTGDYMTFTTGMNGRMITSLELIEGFTSNLLVYYLDGYGDSRVVYPNQISAIYCPHANGNKNP